MLLYHGVTVGHKGGSYPLYVYPESWHIFEPQEGDRNIDGYVFWGRAKVWHRNGELSKEPHELPISERNGKAFIMPERE